MSLILSGVVVPCVQLPPPVASSVASATAVSQLGMETYKALRNASSNFIARKDVKEYIKAKYLNKCCICGSREHLQIDHVVSVLQFAQKRLPYKDLNKEDNLALLCRSCNAAKEP